MHAHRRLPDVPTSRTSRNIPMRVVRCQLSPLHQGVCWQLSHLTAQPSKDGAV